MNIELKIKKILKKQQKIIDQEKKLFNLPITEENKEIFEKYINEKDKKDANK